MALLSPWFLAGALAVGLPLWLHLLQRENPVKLRISSLMFFEKRTQSTIRERRFRHLLLLALRLALLLLLALAFAKPIWERPPAVVAGDIPSLHVIALDTSLSMQHSDRWTRAREAANGIIDSLDEGDRAQVIANGPSVSVVTDAIDDRVELRNAVASLAPTAARNSFGDVIEALRSLAPNADYPVEAHLISDYQNTAMPGRFNDLVLPATAALQIHNVAGDAAPNWAVESVKGSRQLFGVDRPKLEVTVGGYATPKVNKRVVLTIDGRQIADRNRRNSGGTGAQPLRSKISTRRGASAARSSSSSRPTISRPTTAAWRRWTMPSPIRCSSSAPTTASAICSITAPRWGPPPALASRWSRPRRAKPSGSTPSGMR